MVLFFFFETEYDPKKFTALFCNIRTVPILRLYVALPIGLYINKNVNWEF